MHEASTFPVLRRFSQLAVFHTGGSIRGAEGQMVWEAEFHVWRAPTFNLIKLCLSGGSEGEGEGAVPMTMPFVARWLDKASVP